MPRITRKFEFDAGHRVYGHEGKCAHLHGHRYVAEVTIDAPALDKLGRVVDFSEVKRLIGTWIDYNWDHNILLMEIDPLAILFSRMKCGSGGTAQGLLSQAFTRAPWITKKNPTAENMAEMLWHSCLTLLPENLTVRRVRLYETPNCWADYPVHGGPHDDEFCDRSALDDTPLE